jgi:hypothetical protein
MSWSLMTYCRLRGHNGHVCLEVGFTSSNSDHGEVYSIQHYVIKFVTDLRQIGGFLLVLRFPPPIKLTAMI